ncbi:hypothetical protein NKJ23_15830 [Mesorhizobium sp. M0184]|uniref:hypothetical protein n=1 Tax=Mesorhizobium sp. M0184 TaxID=2956906 RepID=UPI00333BE0DE
MEKVIAIDSELERQYHYADGAIFNVPEPKTVHVIADDRGVTHRVISRNGRTYRPERNWIGISWLPAAGEAPFVA